MADGHARDAVLLRVAKNYQKGDPQGTETSSKLGRHRWVIERTLAWLTGYRRLTVRYERRPPDSGGRRRLQAPPSSANSVVRRHGFLVMTDLRH
jgi:hypothetical protein